MQRYLCTKDRGTQGQGYTRTGVHKGRGTQGQGYTKTGVHKDRGTQGQEYTRTDVHKDKYKDRGTKTSVEKKTYAENRCTEHRCTEGQVYIRTGVQITSTSVLKTCIQKDS